MKKIAVLIAAGSGMGADAAKVLFNDGYKIAIMSSSGKGKELARKLKGIGYTVFGGIDSPYVWCKTPPKVTSWEFFDFILQNIQVVAIPGIGFGNAGEGYIRFSAFASSEAVRKTIERFKSLA